MKTKANLRKTKCWMLCVFFSPVKYKEIEPVWRQGWEHSYFKFTPFTVYNVLFWWVCCLSFHMATDNSKLPRIYGSRLLHGPWIVARGLNQPAATWSYSIMAARDSIYSWGQQCPLTHRARPFWGLENHAMQHNHDLHPDFPSAAAPEKSDSAQSLADGHLCHITITHHASSCLTQCVLSLITETAGEQLRTGVNRGAQLHFTPEEVCSQVRAEIISKAA